MNYLEFARKIQMYMQVRGILFSCVITDKADGTFTVENKNGIPFLLDIVEKESVGFSAIKGDGLLVEIYETEEGKVETSIVNGTAIVTEIGIKEKVDTAIGAILANMIACSLEIAAKNGVSVISTLGNAISAELTVEEKAKMDIAVGMLDINALPFSWGAGEGSDMDISIDTLLGLLVSYSVGEKLQASLAAVVGNATILEVNPITEKTSFTALIRLMVEAILESYEDYTLAEMGDSTLEELSNIYI